MPWLLRSRIQGAVTSGSEFQVHAVGSETHKSSVVLAQEYSARSINTSIFVRKAQSFRRLSRFEKLLCLPAWFLLGASRLAVRTVPFRYLAPRLGMPTGVSPWIPLVGPHCEARAASIGKVVRIAAGHTPWESNCLPQAVAARILLGICRIPYSLFFGVALDAKEAKLDAHAWVATGRVSVTGGAGFGQFTVINCFVARFIPNRRPH